MHQTTQVPEAAREHVCSHIFQFGTAEIQVCQVNECARAGSQARRTLLSSDSGPGPFEQGVTTEVQVRQAQKMAKAGYDEPQILLQLSEVRARALLLRDEVQRQRLQVWPQRGQSRTSQPQGVPVESLQ